MLKLYTEIYSYDCDDKIKAATVMKMYAEWIEEANKKCVMEMEERKKYTELLAENEQYGLTAGGVNRRMTVRG